MNGIFTSAKLLDKKCVNVQQPKISRQPNESQQLTESQHSDENTQTEK
jgi:hypothetical protein